LPHRWFARQKSRPPLAGNLFRHISQKASLIHKVLVAFFVSSDEKIDATIARLTFDGQTIDEFESICNNRDVKSSRYEQFRITDELFAEKTAWVIEDARKQRSIANTRSVELNAA
jgi:hypothetical protein